MPRCVYAQRAGSSSGLPFNTAQPMGKRSFRSPEPRAAPPARPPPESVGLLLPPRSVGRSVLPAATASKAPLISAERTALRSFFSTDPPTLSLPLVLARPAGKEPSLGSNVFLSTRRSVGAFNVRRASRVEQKVIRLIANIFARYTRLGSHFASIRAGHAPRSHIGRAMQRMVVSR